MTAAAIRADLAVAADPERAAGMARYFQVRPGGYGEGDRFLGIAVPELRRIARRHAAATSLAEAEDLLTSPLHEERLAALFVLVRRFEAAGDDERARIVELYLRCRAHVSNWDLVDASAPCLLGDVDPAVLDQLAGSASVWDRRIAVMATFAAVRAGRFEPTLRLADRLLADPHDLVQKAVGWMLREVGNRDRALAEEFLGPRYRRMPRTMLRYAIERYPSDRRRAYLAGDV
ncbi:DNA alkylation repair protein [Geodermatophilus sabuli]|uniref:3-methyladenine DNA glycosylase AlkD n=1 Tax=Geodermatophilus sabuli TaxID=1564158 RepID=A0A285EG86_9ACTN|nr:DNA alkylation repair protein [Geodermatophilus sabuli]MBB3083013.1 3-methyladenine DNA glycosylase AlkD [Geodermatophilus sabuli]SNX98010.1 3-methyladenine DNA glycosylase AlkD [Geodermatophilus sabuli]